MWELSSVALERWLYRFIAGEGQRGVAPTSPGCVRGWGACCGMRVEHVPAAAMAAHSQVFRH